MFTNEAVTVQMLYEAVCKQYYIQSLASDAILDIPRYSETGLDIRRYSLTICERCACLNIASVQVCTTTRRRRRMTNQEPGFQKVKLLGLGIRFFIHAPLFFEISRLWITEGFSKITHILTVRQFIVTRQLQPQQSFGKGQYISVFRRQE